MKLLTDTWLIFKRNMMVTLRNPVWVALGLIQPLYFLVLFAPLLDSVSKTRGYPPGGAMNVFIPGLLVQLALFSTAFVGFGIIAELRSGVIERLRVTPVSRLGLLLGRALRDLIILLLQSILLVLLAWPTGLRINVLGIAITLGILALLGLTMVSCSYAIALALKSEDALAPLLNGVTLPMMLLSGVLLPLSLAPNWLRSVAWINPLAHVVDAARVLFNGHIGDGAVLDATILMAILASLAAWWAARAFRKAVA